MRATIVAALAALALAALAPGASGGAPSGCPAAWAAGWQKLADKIEAPVYCPTWMPNPLDAKIGGQYQDIYSIGKDRSYLVSFLEHGDLGSGDVHVNFRGYPGRTTIPTCQTIALEGTKTIRGVTNCFADPRGTQKAPGHHGDGVPRQPGRRPVARPARLALQPTRSTPSAST